MLLYTYISRFPVNPHYQQQFYLRPSFIAFFNFPHKRPTFAFAGESGYTLGFRRKIAHNGSHGETRGVSDGVVSLPSERSARFGNPARPGVRTANFAAFGSWSGGALEERRKPSGQRCAYARRCSEASRPRWAALPCCRCSFSMTCLDSGIERLDQAFWQSYYHTQQPNGQPFGACVGAASGSKMRAITLDFKESHHGRT